MDVGGSVEGVVGVGGGGRTVEMDGVGWEER